MFSREPNTKCKLLSVFLTSHWTSKTRRTVTKATRFDFHSFRSCFYHSSSFDDSIVEVQHGKAIKCNSLGHIHVGNHLLNLYVKSRSFDNAQKLFDEIPKRDARTWTILVSGFAQMGSIEMVLALLRDMQSDGSCPNQFTLSCVLKCCSRANELRAGEEIHGWMLRNGIELDVVLGNSILDFYVKCGAYAYAIRLFESMVERDTVSWNIMIGGYLSNGNIENALELFREMPFKDVASWNTIIDGLMRNGVERIALELLYQMVVIGPLFNKMTFSISLILVSSLSLLEVGRQVHGRVLRVGIHNNGFIINSLIDMYSKCGEMEKALVIYKYASQDYARAQNFKSFYGETMEEAVAWSSIVSGYVQNGRWKDALTTFISMVRERIKVHKFTLTSVVSASASAGTLELGRQIHSYIQKIGHELDVFLCSSMIDMYAKCGSLDDAWLIFKQSNDKNVVLWTSMISGSALHGQGREAAGLFELMIKEGIVPNEISFVGILTACSHAGLLEEGKRYFRLMKEAYGIKPGIEHFNCMVDLYGRAGHLYEAKQFIFESGISHLSTIWRTLLSSCRLHNDMKMGNWVSEKLLKLEPLDPEPYILLSNICATEHRWEEAAEVRSLMQQRGVKKHPGQSWICLKNQVHNFVMGDRTHPQDSEIYSYLNNLISRLKEIGYSFDVKLVMQDVEEEQGEFLLGVHSEKLAIAFGIISTSPSTPIRVMKNLRICTDCHNFVKYTSKHLVREIIVRDIRRFHHFKHGRCSCGDYW